MLWWLSVTCTMHVLSIPLYCHRTGMGPASSGERVPYLGASDERSVDEQNAEALRLSVVEELLGEDLDLPLLCEP